MSDDFPLSGPPVPGPRGASVSHWGPGAFDDDYARWRAEYEWDLRSRPPRRRRPVAGFALLALVLLCVAFTLAPVFAFRSVRAAAQFGDVEALNQAVDFDAVRQSLRVQLRPGSAEATAPTSVLRDPLAALRRAWEPISPQEDVNAYLTAESLAALMSGRGPNGPASVAEGPIGGPTPRLRYLDFGRARLGVKDPEQPGRETVFTFRRRNLFSWTLVGVRLPASPPAAG
jgi:hypothetical protein